MIARTVRRLVPPTAQERAYGLITFTDSLGTGCFLAVSVVLFVRVMGVSATEVGTALGIGGVLSLFARVPLGRLSDRIGHRRSLVLVHLIRAVVFPVYLVVHGFGPFLLITLFVLIIDGWESPVRKVVLYAFAAPADRIRIAAYNRSVYNLAFALGSLLGSLALSGHGRLTLQLVVVGNALSFLIAAGFAGRLPADPVRSVAPASSGAGHLRFAAVGLLLGTLFLCTSLLMIGLPLLVLGHFTDQRWLIGVAMTVNTAVAVTLQVRVSRGADDIGGATRVAVRGGALLVAASGLYFVCAHAGSSVLGVGLLLLATITLSLGELSASAAVWGLGLTLRRHDVTAHNQSMWSMYNSLPQLIGPFVVAWSLHLFHDVGWLVLAAVIGLATLALRPVALAVDARIARAETADVYAG